VSLSSAANIFATPGLQCASTSRNDKASSRRQCSYLCKWSRAEGCTNESLWARRRLDCCTYAAKDMGATFVQCHQMVEFTVLACLLRSSSYRRSVAKARCAVQPGRKLRAV